MMLWRCRPFGPDTPASRRGWWQESPITRETTKETVKTIARGMPGVSGVTVVTNARAFYTTRGCGRTRRPAFPAPSLLGPLFPASSGRIAPRQCGVLPWRCLIRGVYRPAVAPQVTHATSPPAANKTGAIWSRLRKLRLNPRLNLRLNLRLLLNPRHRRAGFSFCLG